jgi:Holliday junction resolvasome RuvABC endonuclease subunit
MTLVVGGSGQLQGMLMDVLYNKGVQFDIVRPSVWKSFLGVAKGKRDEQKAKTLEKIEKKYEVELDGNDDIADAIGIGHYAVNKLLEVEL